MNFYSGLLRRVAKEESGAVIIIVAFLLIALLGMTALAVDVGQLYQARRQMVTAADAGALAGVVDLIENKDQDSAESVARNYAIDNESEAGNTDVNVINGYTVEVWSGKTVNYSFARILGFESQVVTAYARAMYAPIKTAEIIPLTIHEDNYDDGKKITIKYSHHSDGDLGSGNFHPLALGGTGANKYKDNLANGYDGLISIGMPLDTESGNMSGPTSQGLQPRFDACGKPCVDGYYDEDGESICKDPDCPRKVIIPLYEEVEYQSQGNQNKVSKVIVSGFAQIYLLNVSEQGNESIVNAVFLRNLEDGEIEEVFDESIDFGVYNVRLLE